MVYPRIRAFTLIELLIVVAIIAILAAIAVPNFLEAQTRARATRAKSDMRTMALALEAYHVDNNVYPIPANASGRSQLRRVSGFTEWFETRLSPELTTPIAYIDSLIAEPFAAFDDGENPQFHYATRDYVLRTEGTDEEFDELVSSVTTIHSGRVTYFILSHGPDRDHDFAEGGEHHHEETGGEEEEEEEHEHEHAPDPALYDPTNGTISNGDLVYWGGGGGFRN